MKFTPVFDRLVPDPALHLLWSLEDRGISIRVDDGLLVLKPVSLIPEADRGLIRRHKFHLLHLVSECLKEEAP
jgi:hypothetical protein